MAVPASFNESNAVIGPGENPDTECLSVCRAKMGDQDTTVTCWKLTQEELDEINRTGRVWLVVKGRRMLPCYVIGTKPFEGTVDE